MKTRQRPHTPVTNRRQFLVGGVTLAAVAMYSRGAAARSQASPTTVRAKGASHGGTIATRDGTRIFYKDWGAGRPIVFSHGWPLSADAWDEQMLFFSSRGYRTIAHDRRGHGRSDQPWNGNDMDTYADDLATLIEKLDLRDTVVIGHSSGAGEVTRYLGRHGARRVSRLVLASAIPPLLIKTEANPLGVPRESFDASRAGVATNRSQFYQDISSPFFGGNRPGAKVSQGLRDQFWLQSMQCGLVGAFDCIKAFSETDFTEDLKKIEVPTLIIHGEDDQFVPVDATARVSVKLLKRATLKVYAGAPHGLPMTLAERFNTDVLDFLRA